MTLKSDFLALRRGTSRGRDTYGYNLVTATSTRTGRKYRTCGGGYDMAGTVLGDYLQDVAQDRLAALRETVATEPYGCGGGWTHAVDRAYYGLTWSPSGLAYLDGVCGVSCMERLAARVGIDVSPVYDRSTRRCQLSGWMVQDHGSARMLQALRAAELEHAYGADAAGVTP